MTTAKYAYSLKTERVKEKDFPYKGQNVTSTNELRDFVQKLQDSDIEKLIVIYLDAALNLMGILPIMGTLNQAIAYPREILKHALLCSASSVIIVHNHPSGSLIPSDADIVFTRKVKDALKTIDIELLDSAIFAEKGFYSFRDSGLL